MRIRFLWIGDTKNSFYSGLETAYLERINRFVPSEVSSIPEQKKSDRRTIASQLDKENQRIQKRLSNRTFLAVLDQRGQQVTSRGLAEKLNFLMNSGTSEVTFLVGGHIGLPKETIGRANWQWSLGKLTLPHELARVVVLEQVYRAFSILKGLPYHR
ncbi:MAG: 23S rRNA (pseudouridine(1915)-N(3))-methyltransferase RlmH [Acidobacteriota bacterium]|nr:MAG: 23S rRNA (pseudouridine(1915)-N(3))-methyltransferase RlmH [Acidobacteriota bacterium]